MTGLVNLGNTCYMNSVLQMLFNFKSLVYTLKSSVKCLKQKRRENPLLNSLYILFEEMESSDSNLAPVSLKKNIDIFFPKFKDKIEHDAHEFLLDLIDFLHRFTYNKYTIQIDNLKDYSSNIYKDYVKSFYDCFKFNTYISRQMYSCLTKTRICDDCENKTYKFEHFLSFDLDINNDNESLNTLLTRYFATDYIYIECEKCGSTYHNVEHSVDTTINKLPSILFITLKRFSFINGEQFKNNKKVIIPQDINLSKFYSTLDETNTQYNLKHIICHTGNYIDTGHYFTLSKYFDNWCRFDDTKVTRNIFENINDLDPSLPYILAYERL